MANSNQPSGLTPIETLGTLGAYRLRPYAIASGYASNIFSGDPVIFATDALNNRINVSTNSSTPLLGVFSHCEYMPAGGQFQQFKYWAAAATTQDGTDATAYVYDDPRAIFAVQVSAGFANTNVQDCANILYTAGSTSTGRSAVQLNSSTYNNATNANEQLKVYQLWNDAVGNAYGTNAKVLVLINNHVYAGNPMGGK